MTSKLKAGDYGSRQEFADDFNLMLSNAYLFNPTGTQPHNDALEVEKLFKKSTPCFITFRPFTYNLLVWKQTDDAVEKDKAKVRPSVPAPVAAQVAPQDMDVDDELLEAAEAPEDMSGEEDATFDEDVDDLLLGTSSAAPSIPAPKIKFKGIRRPAPDMDDDLDAELYDAADAIGSVDSPAPPKVKEEDIPIARPRLKVSLGAPKPAASVSLATPEVVVPRVVESTPPPPPRVDTPHSGITSSDKPSGSRKRASSPRDLEDAHSIPVDVAKCKALLQKLGEAQFGWIFAYPVDSTQPGLES